MLTYDSAGPGDLVAAPSATGVLTQAANAAASASEPDGVGTVQYVTTRGWLFGADVNSPGQLNAVVYPTITRWWLAADGAVRVDQQRDTPLGLDGRLANDGVGSIEPSGSETLPPGTIDARLTARLSTAPADLRAELVATQVGLPCDQDARWQTECLTLAVQQIYDQYVVTPQLASAIWTVLAGEEPLRDLGSTVDRLGRPAIAVALPSDPTQAEQSVTVLLISNATGAYLGREAITLRDDSLSIDEPTVTGFSALETSGRVKALGLMP